MPSRSTFKSFLCITSAVLLLGCAGPSAQQPDDQTGAGTTGAGGETNDENPCAINENPKTIPDGPLSVAPGEPPSWLLDTAKHWIDWVPNHYERATGNNAAIVNYGLGMLYVDREDGVRGYFTFHDDGSANALWMDLDGSDHYWVLRTDGQVLHGSMNEVLAGELKTGPTLEGSFVQADAAGKIVVLVSSESLLVLEDGKQIDSTLPSEGFLFDRIFVRSDDLIVAQGTSLDAGGETEIWISDDAARSWRRSAFQTSAIKQFGSLISNTRIDNCRIALAEDGKTWIQIDEGSWPVSDDLTAWSAFTTWNSIARWRTPLDLSTDSNPPAPPVSMGKPVKGDESEVCEGPGEYPGGGGSGFGTVGRGGAKCTGFTCAPLTGPKPEPGVKQFGIISDGICLDLETDPLACRDIQRNQSFSAWVTPEGQVDLVAPPAECPAMADSRDARGMAFLACQPTEEPYDAHRIFMRQHDGDAWEGLMTFHLGKKSKWGVSQARDGTIGVHNTCVTSPEQDEELCALYILDPSELTWREVDPAGVLVYRAAPDAGALLVVQGKSDTFSLVLDKPGFWGDQHVMVPSFSLPEGHYAMDVSLTEDGTVHLLTVDSNRDKHTWTFDPDGSLRDR